MKLLAKICLYMSVGEVTVLGIKHLQSPFPATAPKNLKRKADAQFQEWTLVGI